MKKRILFTAGILLTTSGCMSRNYTYFLVSPPLNNNAALEETGTPLRVYEASTAPTMKVKWNDGQVFTEVDLPMLSTGQRIIVDHQGPLTASLDQTPPPGVVPPAPGAADKTLADAYREKGLRENTAAPDVSISRSKMVMQDAIAKGNYSLALEYSNAVLNRYPSHPEFLRAKGSILLLMGERDKAIEFYERAEEVETDPKVKRKLEELRK